MKERLNADPHVMEFVLDRNQYFPNSELPVLIYRQAILLPQQKNRASGMMQKKFLLNGWRNSWRDGIYDFHHFHSTTHECMGISMGAATLTLGGPDGKQIKVSQGDVLIIPAGVAHKCEAADKDFLCVGAYPNGKDCDICTGKASEYDDVITRIGKLGIPLKDPIYGLHGFLKDYWKQTIQLQKII